MPAVCDKLVACAPRSLQSHVANLQSKSTGQVGGVGRRARLRKAKSMISKHHFSFQKRSLSREENALVLQNERSSRRRSRNIIILVPILVHRRARVHPLLAQRLKRVVATGHELSWRLH